MTTHGQKGLHHRAWLTPVVVSAFAGAADGKVQVPPELVEHFTFGPFDSAGLPQITARAPNARTLLMAFERVLASPALGELPDPPQRAIVVGTRLAALHETVNFLTEVEQVGPSLVNPGLFPFTVMNAAAGMAAIQYQCRGANLTVNNGATSIVDALAIAADLISSGQAEMVFAGGFEGLGAQASRALGQPRDPAYLATVFALTSQTETHRRGDRPGCRLLSFSTGDFPELDHRVAAQTVLQAAYEASGYLPGPLDLPPRSRIDDEAGPEVALFDILHAVHETFDRRGDFVVPVLAGSPGDTARSALLLGPLSS